MERRAKATLWAQTILKDHPRIKGSEQLNVQSALVEAAMQEIPLKSLVVGINDNGGHYKITLKGYRNILDTVIWSQTFHNQNRARHLRSIGKTYTQLTQTGVIKILNVKKGTATADDDEDEELVPFAGNAPETDIPASIGRYDQRAKAVQWARTVLADHHEVKQQDRPYVEASLVEAAMQESPLPKALAVGINEQDDCYNITLHGYHNPLEDVQWTNAFHGRHRTEMMDNVTKSYSQLTEQGAVMVICVSKVKLSGQREDAK
jgi:hypothetical protein